MSRLISSVLILCSLLLSASAFVGLWWQNYWTTALEIPEQGFTFQVQAGQTLHSVADQLHQQGVLSHPTLFSWFSVLQDQDKHMKVGEYQLEVGTTPRRLLQKLINGEVVQYALTIVEGWTVQQLLKAIETHPKINSTLHSVGLNDLLTHLDLPAGSPEGLFFPDTYFFTAGTSDVVLLKRAYDLRKERLEKAWNEREKDLPFKTPYEALTLASIIEKETSVQNELPQVAGVYIRRLEKKMLLQADPVVIYGLLDVLEGPLLYKHLRIDTPYNTYLRIGLPPTPIALPGEKAVFAALHPATGNFLYFVANGRGGHVFSATLEEHQQAVQAFRAERNQE